MSPNTVRRTAVGFHGGQVLSLRLPEEVLTSLRETLKAGKERWVEVCSAAPARMFGLAGRKGVVAPGADADLVVYDPGKRHTISAQTHHMDVDYSCYEGREVTGASEVVLSRGQVIVEDGQYLGKAGDGRFLKRSVARDYLI